MTTPRAATCLAGLLVLQAIFATILPIITSTSLDVDGVCYLNQGGSVCGFVYATSGFSLLFTLLMALCVAATLRQGPGSFLPSEAGAVAAFGSLWWVATAVTVTQRGKQAANSGLPEGSARDAVAALAWLEFALFVLATACVAYDRLAHRRQRVHFVSLADAAAKLQRAQEEESFKRQSQDSLHVV